VTRALITGITGMVGSHLLDYLMNNTDWEIHGLYRWRSPLDNLIHHIPEIETRNRINLRFGDLRDTLSIFNLLESCKPDFVFHLAAQSFPKTSFESPLEAYDTNILGTERILAATRRFSPNAVVHVCSSSEVFGRVKNEQLPISESCSFHPASPYAISKVGTDLIGRYYAEAYGLNVVTTRMFTHTGPRRGDIFAESSFAKQIALIEAKIIPPEISVGNLESLRTWLDVRDAVKAYFLLVTKNPLKGESYNIGGSTTKTIRDILTMLIEASNVDFEIAIRQDKDRYRAIDADLQVPDSSKFINHTGWSPEISIEQTLRDLLDYWRKKVGSNQAVLSR